MMKFSRAQRASALAVAALFLEGVLASSFVCSDYPITCVNSVPVAGYMVYEHSSGTKSITQIPRLQSLGLNVTCTGPLCVGPSGPVRLTDPLPPVCPDGNSPVKSMGGSGPTSLSDLPPLVLQIQRPTTADLLADWVETVITVEFWHPEMLQSSTRWYRAIATLDGSPLPCGPESPVASAIAEKGISAFAGYFSTASPPNYDAESLCGKTFHVSKMHKGSTENAPASVDGVVVKYFDALSNKDSTQVNQTFLDSDPSGWGFTMEVGAGTGPCSLSTIIPVTRMTGTTCDSYFSQHIPEGCSCRPICSFGEPVGEYVCGTDGFYDDKGWPRCIDTANGEPLLVTAQRAVLEVSIRSARGGPGLSLEHTTDQLGVAELVASAIEKKYRGTTQASVIAVVPQHVVKALQDGHRRRLQELSSDTEAVAESDVEKLVLDSLHMSSTYVERAGHTIESPYNEVQEQPDEGHARNLQDDGGFYDAKFWICIDIIPVSAPAKSVFTFLRDGELRDMILDDVMATHGKQLQLGISSGDVRVVADVPVERPKDTEASLDSWGLEPWIIFLISALSTFFIGGTVVVVVSYYSKDEPAAAEAGGGSGGSKGEQPQDYSAGEGSDGDGAMYFGDDAMPTHQVPRMSVANKGGKGKARGPNDYY